MSELDCEVIVDDRAYKESEILKWKQKAEKYDEVMKIENSLNGGSIRSGKKPYALQILIERDEALKRCEELEQTNKVLVDGVRALDIHHEEDIEYLEMYDESGYDYVTFCKGRKNKEKYNLIKAMLEVVEVDE